VAPSPAAEEAPSPAAAVPEITIADFAYAVPSSVPAGAAVRVVNRDREAHTVTLGGGDGTSVTVAGGASGTLTAPAAAGSYPVGCDFHGDMTSTLVVV
jgi:plastocyanin